MKAIRNEFETKLKTNEANRDIEIAAIKKLTQKGHRKNTILSSNKINKIHESEIERLERKRLLLQATFNKMIEDQEKSQNDKINKLSKEIYRLEAENKLHIKKIKEITETKEIILEKLQIKN